MKKLHIQTPLLELRTPTPPLKARIWLKMEALQPCGSFKTRGIGFACQEYVARGAKKLLSSSGGNAGLSVAYAGRQMNVPVVVVVPQTTTEHAKELIRLEGAELIVKGESWNEANQHALSLCDDKTAYIKPFDDPLLWQGHSSMIDEVHAAGLVPDTVVLSVGGGGLLCGVLEGLHRHGWEAVPVLAVETQGADSFHQSVQAGRLVKLDRITSIASSLGAKQAAPVALEWTKRHSIKTCTVSDREALDACLRFCDDMRTLVEPACGASLAAVYGGAPFLKDKRNVLVIVCGGVGVTRSQLDAWRADLAE